MLPEAGFTILMCSGDNRRRRVATEMDFESAMIKRSTTTNKESSHGDDTFSGMLLFGKTRRETIKTG